MAKLYFYYASMNAGKSATLLQADFNYNERGMRTMLWTAKLDDRSEMRGDGHAIESRIGLHAGAHRFSAETDLLERVQETHAVEPLSCILIDEAQFLTEEQVWQCADIADKANIPVLCYGLRTDFRGQLAATTVTSPCAAVISARHLDAESDRGAVAVEPCRA